MQSDSYWQDQPAYASARPRRTRFWIVVFLFLVLIACTSGLLLIPGGMGFFAGYEQLQAQNHESAIQHFQRGLGYLSENYPELAYTEFQISLRYDDSYEPAREKLIELQPSVGTLGTPGPAEEDLVAAALFDEAQTLVTNKQWNAAINRLEQLRALKPTFRPIEATDLLYQAYVASGKEAVAATQIELARERFDAALALRSGDPEVQRQRDLAVLYLDGQQAVGYKWDVAVQKFAALYQQEPNYDDVKTRLVDAYNQYGDLAMKQSAWCLAAKEYDGALAIVKDPQIGDKRAQAMGLCRQAVVATPTPSPVPGADNYVAKISTSNQACSNGAGDVTGIVRDINSQPLPNIMVAYYADCVNRVTTRTNANGQYQFTWGADPGVFHVIVLSADGKTAAGIPADVNYPGGNKTGCHIVVDWQKTQ